MSVTVRLRPFRVPLKVGYDALAWTVASALASMLRYQLPGDVPWRAVVGLALALGTVYFLVGLLVQLHQGRAATGSLEEMLLVGCVATTAGMTVFAANLVLLRVAALGAGRRHHLLHRGGGAGARDVADR